MDRNANNHRSGSVTVDQQISQLAVPQGKLHKKQFMANQEHIYANQQDQSEMSNLPPILKNQNNLITRNQGNLQNSQGQMHSGVNQFAKMHKRIETQNPYRQVGTFAASVKQRDHTNSMKHVSPFLQSPPNIQQHTLDDMLQSHANYHPNLLKHSPTGSHSPTGPVKAFPTPMNSVGPLLNDMPENQLALDHSNQSSPREPLNDGEGEM